MTRRSYRLRLRRAGELASARASRFREARYSRTGKGFLGWKMVEVTGERHRANLIARGARPVLKSSEWREIYREVGLA